MQLQERSFEQLVEVYRTIRPELVHFSQDNTGHYDATEAYSHRDISAWPSNPPTPGLFRMRNPDGYSSGLWTDAKKLVDYCHFQAVGTWNANGLATWQCGEGWIVAQVELTQEQADDDYGDDEGSGGDYVSVTFGLRRVSDGFAAVVWPLFQKDTFAQVFGVEGWTQEGWKQDTVWYGE